MRSKRSASGRGADPVSEGSSSPSGSSWGAAGAALADALATGLGSSGTGNDVPAGGCGGEGAGEGRVHATGSATRSIANDDGERMILGRLGERRLG